jgi:predicted  nucleic acid-binding Zn-ribbon protein
MSTTVTPFQKFVALISFDQENNQIRQQLKDLDDNIKYLNQMLINTEYELTAAHDSVKTAQKTVDATELANQELDATEKTKKAQLEQVQDKKEYAALKKEITYLKEQQHNNELILVQAWTKLETAKQVFEKQKELLNQKITEIKTDISAKQAKIIELTKQVNNYELERKAKETGVPSEWLVKYSIMRTRVQNPVVQVVNGSCMACFYDVTQQDINALKDNRLVECRGCFRFLYLT